MREDRSLDVALRSLRDLVEFPETPSLAPAVTSRLRADAARAARPPFPGIALWSRRRVVVAIALAVMLIGGAAVAGRLAIGAIRIEVVPSLAPSAPPEAPAAFGGEVTLRHAIARTGLKPGWPPGFGPPDNVYVVSAPGGGQGLVLAWRHAEGMPTIPDTPWQAVLFELRARAEVAAKYVGTYSIDVAVVDGQRAFWISGAHDLALAGEFGGEVVRVSGNVLVWQRSTDVTYRLETMLPKAEAVALAETLPTG